jgi:hypothetical protein
MNPLDLQVSEPESRGAETRLTDEVFLSNLASLASRWGAQRDTDLELRHETGLLLNKRFGDPGKRRLPRDQEILKKAAGQLGVNESEISRLRNFAYRFESFQDFKSEHSSVNTWSAVKTLLPSLSPRRGSKQASLGGAANPSFKKVKQSLQNLFPKLQQLVATKLSEEEKKELQEKLKAFTAVADSLQGQSSGAQAPEEGPAPIVDEEGLEDSPPFVHAAGTVEDLASVVA